MKTVIALDAGFYNGRRIRKGQRFGVHDDAKAAWFADAPEAPKPQAEPEAQSKPRGGRRAQGAAGDDLT